MMQQQAWEAVQAQFTGQRYLLSQGRMGLFGEQVCAESIFIKAEFRGQIDQG